MYNALLVVGYKLLSVACDSVHCDIASSALGLPTIANDCLQLHTIANDIFQLHV